MPEWQKAVVLEVSDSRAAIGLSDGATGYIPLGELKWARAWRKNQRRGPKVTAAGQVLKAGQAVLVEALGGGADGRIICTTPSAGLITKPSRTGVIRSGLRKK